MKPDENLPPIEYHIDDIAINYFAQELHIKMAGSRAKGRGGWRMCHEETLLRMLNDHLEKGDMRDIAIIAMMIWYNERFPVE